MSLDTYICVCVCTHMCKKEGYMFNKFDMVPSTVDTGIEVMCQYVLMTLFIFLQRGNCS